MATSHTAKGTLKG